ncbi:MAG: hypothetical protein U0835_16860 [Isosphaeraceae bacterium]
MNAALPSVGRGWDLASFTRVKLWHVAVLVAFVAVAITEVQQQRVREPGLVALAAVGFVGYAALGVVGWKLSRRLVPRIGPAAVLAVYVFGMSALYLVATAVYVTLETLYRTGRL